MQTNGGEPGRDAPDGSEALDGGWRKRSFLAPLPGFRTCWVVSLLLATLLTTLTTGLNGAVASAAPDDPASDGVVRIGLLLDLSGRLAYFAGEGNIIAARMAVEDFGGKVLGHPIELVSADHRNLAHVAAEQASAWFDAGKVDALMDVTATAAALAVAKIAKLKNRIVVFNAPASARLTNEACTPVTAHWRCRSGRAPGCERMGGWSTTCISSKSSGRRNPPGHGTITSCAPPFRPSGHSGRSLVAPAPCSRSERRPMLKSVSMYALALMLGLPLASAAANLREMAGCKPDVDTSVVSREGLFTAHMACDRLLLELPDSLYDRDML